MDLPGNTGSVPTKTYWLAQERPLASLNKKMSPSPHAHGCIVEIFSPLNSKVVMASLLKIPSYLKRVVTLPCEIFGIWPGFLCHPSYELLEALEMASSQIYSAAPERVPPACGRT